MLDSEVGRILSLTRPLPTQCRYYFCSKMSRLVILLGPMASCLGSIFLVWVLEWATSEMFEFFNESMDESEEAAEEDAGPTASPAPGSAKKGKKKKKGPAVSSPTPSKGGEKKNKKGGAPKNAVDNMVKPIKEWYAENKGSRRIMAFSLSLFLLSLSSFFYRCESPLFSVRTDSTFLLTALCRANPVFPASVVSLATPLAVTCSPPGSPHVLTTAFALPQVLVLDWGANVRAFHHVPSQVWFRRDDHGG